MVVSCAAHCNLRFGPFLGGSGRVLIRAGRRGRSLFHLSCLMGAGNFKLLANDTKHKGAAVVHG